MLAFMANSNLAGYVRGVQIAEFLQRPLNPATGEFTRIYIKQTPQQWPGECYLDVLDGMHLREPLLAYPNVKVIAFTQSSCDYLAKFLQRPAVYIPQHHCNFERERRPQRDIRVVGFVGSPTSLEFYIGEKIDLDVWTRAFAEYGFEFRCMFTNRRGFAERYGRSVVVDFYKQVDIQVYARRATYTFRRFKDHLKIANAGSFGIPSVIQPEDNIFSQFTLPASSLQEMIQQCVRLRNNTSLYEELSQELISATEQFHIEHIAPLYLSLEQN